MDCSWFSCCGRLRPGGIVLGDVLDYLFHNWNNLCTNSYKCGYSPATTRYSLYFGRIDNDCFGFLCLANYDAYWTVFEVEKMKKVFLTDDYDLEVGDKVIFYHSVEEPKTEYYRVLEITSMIKDPIMFTNLITRDHIAWAYPRALRHVVAEKTE